MKNIIMLFLFSILSIACFGESDSVKIISFDISECINGDGCERGANYRVINSKFNHDTLDINIKGYANCAGAHNAQVTRIKNEIFITFEDGKGIDLSSADTSGFSIDKITKDTSYLIWYDGDDPVDCDCFYDFNFKILGLDSSQSYHYYINDKAILCVTEYDSLRLCVLIDNLKKSKSIIEEYNNLSIKYNYPQEINVKYSFTKNGYSPEASYYSISFWCKELGSDFPQFTFIMYKYQNYRVIFYDSNKKKQVDLSEWLEKNN